MPELPDLQLFSANLRKTLLARQIEEVTCDNPRRLNVPTQAFVSALTGASFQRIEREGKELWFTLSNGQCFSVHLMLCGMFSFENSPLPSGSAPANPSPPAKLRGKILSLGLEEGLIFHVSDERGLCRVSLNPKLPRSPDSMSSRFTLAYLSDYLARNPFLNIKSILVCQKVVRGIGNAYVDEILYRAMISPACLAGRIPMEAQERLFAAIGQVLREAMLSLEQLCPDAINGEERSFLKVHNPNLTTTEAGEPIKVQYIAGAKTYYTDRQVLY